MHALVVYESVYGNTRAVAEAIAAGLGGAEVVAAAQAPSQIDDVDLVVAGGPTHMHGMTTTRSRRMAVEAAQEDGTGHVEPRAADEPGLRAWIRDLSTGAGVRAAAFDTRADKAAWLTGAASRGIAARLRHRGCELVGTESFLVEASEGPLEQGELERARDWGAMLATSVAAAASPVAR